jgi:hypothetical protein
MKETNTISMMNFENFKKVIMKKAEPVAGEGGTVDITHVIKNNGCEYDGLIILNKGSVISPTIYLNDYYEQYVNGKSIDSIFAGIKELYYLNKDRLSVDTQSLNSNHIHMSLNNNWCSCASLSCWLSYNNIEILILSVIKSSFLGKINKISAYLLNIA